VGQRWAELRERSEARFEDHLLVFADVHYAMALATDTSNAVDRWFASARDFAQKRDLMEGDVMAEPGLALGEAALAHRRGEHERVVTLLYPARSLIRRIGGSHAQRDLFEQMLVDSALKAQRYTLARALLSERLTLRPDNLWGWRQLAKLAAAGGDPATLARADATARRLLVH